RGHAVLPREHPRELLLLNEPEVDQGVADAVAGGARFGEPLLELLLGDQPFTDEEITEANFLSDLGHRRAYPERGNGGEAAVCHTGFKTMDVAGQTTRQQ